MKYLEELVNDAAPKSLTLFSSSPSLLARQNSALSGRHCDSPQAVCPQWSCQPEPRAPSRRGAPASPSPAQPSPAARPPAPPRLAAAAMRGLYLPLPFPIQTFAPRSSKYWFKRSSRSFGKTHLNVLNVDSVHCEEYLKDWDQQGSSALC